jgi:hypothetical protein
MTPMRNMCLPCADVSCALVSQLGCVAGGLCNKPAKHSLCALWESGACPSLADDHQSSYSKLQNAD